MPINKETKPIKSETESLLIAAQNNAMRTNYAKTKIGGETDPYEQMVYAQPRICPWEWERQNFLGSWDTNRSPNLGQMTRPSDSQKKKKKRETAE